MRAKKRLEFRPTAVLSCRVGRRGVLVNCRNCATLEPLEPRTFLRAGGTLDPTFGSGGLLSGEAPVSVRIDGTMVADPDAGDLAVLNPDGSFDVVFTPPVSRGPTSGKSLRLSGGSISRVNADGTPDATFSNAGTVSDLTSGTTVASFSPQALFSG